MELELNLLLYLDKKKILNDMKYECENFLNLLSDKTVYKIPPLRYLLEVDVIELYELFPELGDFLVREPLKWKQHCNDILYACLKSLDNDYNTMIQSSQVGVNIRLKCLPSVLQNLKQRKYTTIALFNGLLIDISKPMNFAYHTVWSCPENCEGNEIVLQHIPKVPPKCYICRSVLFENSGMRRCGTNVNATFMFKSEMLPKQFIIVDDLIQKLKLGGKYAIHAVVLKKSIFIWSIEELVAHPTPLTSPIPPDINKLFDKCCYIPWKFIYCLASTIGLQVCPFYCFMGVKVNLLLSLVSIKANAILGSAIIHILVRGYDTGKVAELMTQAVILADSHTFLGTSQCSVSTSMIGASGGVCVLPLSLKCYSQKQIYSLLSIIESGKITQGANTAKLNCAVWAHGMDFKKIVVLDNIGKVFGNVCNGDTGEYDDELVDDVLQKATNPHMTTKGEKEPLKNIAVYLDMIGGIKVTSTEETERILRKYFVAARKERPDVSVGSFEALITTCSTSARLCRRDVVNNHDVVFAIWLHVSGMPEPRLAPKDYLDAPNTISMMENMMKKFIDWLEQFVGLIIFSK